MIRRAVFASVVLIGTVYWANCSFELKAPAAEDPAWNGFFDGCYQGPVTDPAGADLILVLEASPDDKLTLAGCLRRTIGSSTENGTLSGMVQETREQAVVTVTTSAGAMYKLRVERNPAGEMDATDVDLSNEGGAPFATAADLARCSAPLPLTCQSMSIRMPFLPGGGTP